MFSPQQQTILLVACSPQPPVTTFHVIIVACLQTLWKLFGNGHHEDIVVMDSRNGSYEALVKSSKYCLAPYGHGWGVRLMNYMVLGCVPVIIQVCKLRM